MAATHPVLNPAALPMPHAPIERVAAPSYAVFRNSMPDANIVFPDGQVAKFLGGRYVTDNANLIAILDAEIGRGHPHLRRGSPEESVGYGDDPIAALRASIIKEFQEDQARIALELANGKDLGTSHQGTLKVQSAKDIASTAAGGFSKT